MLLCPMTAPLLYESDSVYDEAGLFPFSVFLSPVCLKREDNIIVFDGESVHFPDGSVFFSAEGEHLINRQGNGPEMIIVGCLTVVLGHYSRLSNCGFGKLRITGKVHFQPKNRGKAPIFLHFTLR